MTRMSPRLSSILALTLALPLTSMAITSAHAEPSRLTASVTAPRMTGLRVSTPQSPFTAKHNGKLVVSKPRKKMTAASTLSVRLSASQDRTVVISRRQGAQWVTLETRTLAPQETLKFSPGAFVSKPGKHTSRFALSETKTAAASSLTRRVTVAKVSRKPVLTSAVPDLTYSTSKSAVSGTVLAYGQKVSLQRKAGKKWKTVKTVKVANAKTFAGFKLRVPRKAGNHTYRVRSGSTTLTKASLSASFVLHQTDAKKHSGYIAKARRHMKKYCPSTPIYIDSPQILDGGDLAGRASVAWRWTTGPQGSLTWEKSIHLASGLSAKSLRVVAMHECAHIVQYRQLVKSPHAIDQAKKTATKVFKARGRDKGSGFERQADCMVHAWSKKKAKTYYTNTCTPTQKKSARGLLKKYGKKYQSATLTVPMRGKP